MDRFLLVEYFISAFDEKYRAIPSFKQMDLNEMLFYFDSKKIQRLLTMALETGELKMDEMLSAAEEAYNICLDMKVTA